MDYVLSTDNLVKSYGQARALSGLSMHVPKGAIYGIVGRNGAGKTTLIRLICGLQRPTSGTYSIYGREFTSRDIALSRRRMGAVVETPSIYLDMSARENLRQQYRVLGLPSFEGIDELLALVGLADTGKKKARNFSLGMKQRLGIAMALLGSPKLLILDEPTNGLDPAGIQEMRALIRNMPAATGATVLISSHLLGEMEQMVEQVGIIDHGHILFEGPLTELQRHSRGNVTLRLLDPAKAAPILRANGLTAHSDSCVVTLPPLQDALLADLVQKLAACGAGVVELTPHTKTLEEIFLSLTSEEAD